MSGKKYSDASERLDRQKFYDPNEALGLVKELASANFDEAVDIAVGLGVDPRKADQMVRGTVALPSGTGGDVRVAVFAQGDLAAEASEAGADVVGAEDLAERIDGGFTDFDLAIATPDMMPTVGKLGKVLGPKGLMPNPKLGTVTPNVGKAVQDAKGGQVEYRAEKAGIIHVGVGKASFSESAIVENICSLVDAVNKAKPSGAKGTYIEKIFVSSTMGPGIKLDVGPLLERAGES